MSSATTDATTATGGLARIGVLIRRPEAGTLPGTIVVYIFFASLGGAVFMGAPGWSDNVVALVICSWGPAHEEQLLDCIAAGKPVFCEKPMVTSEASAIKVIEAEVAFGRRLVQVGFMRRFDADYRRLKAVIDSGSLGAPLMYHSVHRNASVPSHYTSDMPLNDTLVHDADISRWLLSDEIAGVEVRYPRRSSVGGGELKNPVMVLLHMAGGAIVDVEISVAITYGYDIRGEVSGETGVAALPNRPASVVSDAHGIRQALPEDWRERFIEAYDQEFREWIVAAGQGTATGPSAWDGYASTLTADAALRAADSGRLEDIRMIDKPALYGDATAMAAE